MIYEIKIKEEVREKINDISDYIYRFSFSKEIAIRTYNQIYKEIFSLKIFPNRYPKFNEKYRVLTINKRYRVFFIVDDDNMNITISRIFSSSENYIEIF
jgi:plasmid stabilization system protein ParE